MDPVSVRSPATTRATRSLAALELSAASSTPKPLPDLLPSIGGAHHAYMERAMFIACPALMRATVLVFVGMTVPALAVPTWAIMSVPAAGLLHFAHEGHQHAAQASGKVNAVDVDRRKINLSHDGIKAFALPSMTTDFPVSPSVDLAAVKSGMEVNFSLVRSADGSFVVDALRPLTNGNP